MGREFFSQFARRGGSGELICLVPRKHKATRAAHVAAATTEGADVAPVPEAHRDIGGALVIGMADLVRRNACEAGRRTFSERFAGIKGASFDPKALEWTLSRGWTSDVTAKLARECPSFLRWYVRHGIAPADSGWVEAIREAHGKNTNMSPLFRLAVRAA